MDNKLLDNSVGDLLMAAYRKSVILKLASMGAPIDQDKIDTLCGLLGHSNVLTSAIDKELNKIVVSALGEPPVEELNDYLVVVDSAYTRDTQVAPNGLLEEEDWLDYSGSETVLGKVTSVSEEMAMSYMVDKNITIGMLKAYKIAGVQHD